MSQRRSTFDENFRAINDETTVWVVLEFAWKEMFQSRSGWTGFRTSCSFSIIVIQEENIFDMRLHEMLNRSATSWRNKPTCKGNNTRYSIQATLAASRDCLFLTLNTHHMSVIHSGKNTFMTEVFIQVTTIVHISKHCSCQLRQTL